MGDTKPQTAAGKVLFHFAMSLDGHASGLWTASGSSMLTALTCAWIPLATRLTRPASAIRRRPGRGGRQS
jgi:hypothetical protein